MVAVIHVAIHVQDQDAVQDLAQDLAHHHAHSHAVQVVNLFVNWIDKSDTTQIRG